MGSYGRHYKWQEHKSFTSRTMDNTRACRRAMGNFFSARIQKKEEKEYSPPNTLLLWGIFILVIFIIKGCH